MGPSINGLDRLLKMPYGCGEQNMLNFAPNIFVVKYLEATNNIDGATMEKAKNFMTKGFLPAFISFCKPKLPSDI